MAPEIIARQNIRLDQLIKFKNRSKHISGCFAPTIA